MNTCNVTREGEQVLFRPHPAAPNGSLLRDRLRGLAWTHRGGQMTFIVFEDGRERRVTPNDVRRWFMEGGYAVDEIPPHPGNSTRAKPRTTDQAPGPAPEYEFRDGFYTRVDGSAGKNRDASAPGGKAKWDIPEQRAGESFDDYIRRIFGHDFHTGRARAGSGQAPPRRSGRRRHEPPPRREPPRATEPSPHVVLGVPEGASQATIKSAWRKLIQQHHPDAGGDHAMAQRINAAYHALRKKA